MGQILDDSLAVPASGGLGAEADRIQPPLRRARCSADHGAAAPNAVADFSGEYCFGQDPSRRHRTSDLCPQRNLGVRATPFYLLARRCGKFAVKIDAQGFPSPISLSALRGWFQADPRPAPAMRLR